MKSSQHLFPHLAELRSCSIKATATGPLSGAAYRFSKMLNPNRTDAGVNGLGPSLQDRRLHSPGPRGAVQPDPDGQGHRFHTPSFSPTGRGPPPARVSHKVTSATTLDPANNIRCSQGWSGTCAATGFCYAQTTMDSLWGGRRLPRPLEIRPSRTWGGNSMQRGSRCPKRGRRRTVRVATSVVGWIANKIRGKLRSVASLSTRPLCAHCHRRP